MSSRTACARRTGSDASAYARGSGRPQAGAQLTLGAGEVEHELRAELVGRRLGERALEPCDRGSRRAPGEREASRGAQLIDDPAPAAGLDGEQVGGDRVEAGVPSREQLRGARVEGDVYAGRQACGDGVADDRVDEPQRTHVCEHAGSRQLVGGRLGALDPRELRCDRALDIVAENGDGLGECDRGRVEPHERGADCVANRIDTGVGHPAASAAVNATPSSRRPAANRLNRNGLPPVAVWHAARTRDPRRSGEYRQELQRSL